MRFCIVLVGLVLATVVSARGTRGAALAEPACTCDRGLPYQLLRGADQVSRCEGGYYCECKSGKVLHCFNFLLKFKYNEDGQVCDLNFNCKEFFDNLPTTPATTVSTPTTAPSTKPTTPSTPPTTKPPTSPTTKPTTPPTTKPTTPPTTKPTTLPTTKPTTLPTTKPTTPPTTKPTTPPTTKPTTPPTTKPTTLPTPPTTKPTKPTTPSTPSTSQTEPTGIPPTTPGAIVDPYCLTCDPVKHQRYQLIRGEGEVDKCNERLYCDCEERTQRQCGWLTALNPEDQKCEMFFNCESWLSRHLPK